MGRNRAAMPQLIDTYAFEERAAIREFDAGYGRAKAEWLARADVEEEKQWTLKRSLVSVRSGARSHTSSPPRSAGSANRPSAT